jgi:tRNA threonylcarbamoyladenosine biosynthesis protein TsaB
MDDALILAIETSTGCGSVAITRGDLHRGRIIAEAIAQPEITHSRRLLGSVEWVMAAAGLVWQDLDGIAVSLGPGSFTGLRIGMAAAKGLAMAAELPMIGIETMAGVALSFPFLDRPLWCILDARKQEVYAACFLADKDGLPVQSEAVQAIDPNALAAMLDSPSLLAGTGVYAYRDIFAGLDNAHIVPAALGYPRASMIGFLAARQLALGNIMDQALAAPLYVRAADAEIRRQGAMIEGNLNRKTGND